MPWPLRLFFRVAGTIMCLAGTSAVMASMAIAPMIGDSLVISRLGSAALRAGVALALCGVLAAYVAASRTRILPNERGPADEASGGFGAGLLLLGVGLAALPFWLLFRLQPLVSFWREALALLDQSGAWDALQQNPQDSGLIVAPLMGILAVPILQATAAIGFAAGSVLLIGLLLSRSVWLPRVLLVCVLLEAALVFAGASGAGALSDVRPSLEDAVTDTSPAFADEQRTALDAIQRYETVTLAASRTLWWTLAAYALWIPVLLLPGRARNAFTGPPAP